MSIVYTDPGRLWLLLLVAAAAAAYVVAQFRRPRYVLRFTQLDLLDTVAPRRPRWRKHVVAVATVLGLATLVLAAARPHTETPVASEQAAVLVVLDTSLSMQATDVAPNRFDVAREAAATFVKSIPQPVKVGLESFNGTVSLEVPPTADRGRVVDAIDGLQLGESTAIGDAVTLGVGALQAGGFVATDATDATSPPPASAARIVLLSDGGNTVGRSVDEGIAIAKKAGVPVSTIAYGTPNGTVTYQGETIPVPVDGPTLKRLADETGGGSYAAATGRDLNDVYSDIGSTITVDRELSEITDRFVLVGLLLLLLGSAASLVWFNRIP